MCWFIGSIRTRLEVNYASLLPIYNRKVFNTWLYCSVRDCAVQYVMMGISYIQFALQIHASHERSQFGILFFVSVETYQLSWNLLKTTLVIARQRSCGKVLLSVVSVCLSFCSLGRNLCTRSTTIQGPGSSPPFCTGPQPPAQPPAPGPWPPAPSPPRHFKLVQLGPHWTGPLNRGPLNLFYKRHGLLASGRFAFHWNAFLFRFKNVFYLWEYHPTYFQK